MESDEAERSHWVADFEAAAGRFEYAQAEEKFSDAWARRIEVEGFPVCHLDDIIESKRAANRAKDRETLPRLVAFRDYWRSRHQRTALHSRKRKRGPGGPQFFRLG
jgi:hypothetical protein